METEVFIEPSARALAGFSTSGFAVLEQLVPRTVCSALTEEAQSAYPASWSCERGPEDQPPLQRNRRAELGPIARGLVSDGALLQLLRTTSGLALQPSFEATCFTYYQAGDYLAVHQDRKNSCIMTLLLYLGVRWSQDLGPSPGLSLSVHDREYGPPLLQIPSSVGKAVLLMGSRVWHGRRQLWPQESVSALSACFKEAA